MKYRSHTEENKVLLKDYSKAVIFGLADFTEKGHVLQTVVIPPQTKQRLHKHFKETEVYYIIKGEAIIVINGEEFTAEKGDGFIIDPGDKHGLWNKSDSDFMLVVFKINMPEENDTEWLED